MNILLTSVGRRSYLVEYFKDAVGAEGKVIGANMFADSAGMFAADVSVVTPPAHSDEYVPFLLDVCRQHDVSLLSSLHDLDIFMLSQQQHLFDEQGVRHTLPSAEWGRLCLDKFACNEALKSAGIPTPWTSIDLDEVFSAISNGLVTYPVMVKARIGFGSLGLKVCHDDKQLVEAYNSARHAAMNSGAADFISLPDDKLVVIQPVISGKEVCVGIANDLSGNYQAHFSCEVHSMRAGESDIATSIDRSSFDDIACSFSKLTRHPGIWGVDFLDDSGVWRAIDVNPRFTGDYPFHHLSGANIPAALVAWVNGEPPDSSFFNFEAGIKGYKELSPRRV